MVSSPTDIDTFDLRMPNWVSYPSMPITVNGSATQPVQPGSYVHVAMTPWPKGATTIDCIVTLYSQCTHSQLTIVSLPSGLHSSQMPVSPPF